MHFQIENGIATLTTDSGRKVRCAFRPEYGDTTESVRARLSAPFAKKAKKVVRHVLVNADGSETEFEKVRR